MPEHLSLQAQLLISAAIVVSTLATFAWRFSRSTLWLKAFLAVFLLDQACKEALVPVLAGHPPLVLLGGQLWLVYAENHLPGFGSNCQWLLALVLCSLPMTLRLQKQLAQLGYQMSDYAEAAVGLTLGGLAAIACDRMAKGYAVDFIQFGAAGGFVYNPADLAVLLAGGVVALRLIHLVATGQLRQAVQLAAVNASKCDR
jgi:lipoprotein signal peptidase